jgi:hypothetical protein
MSKEEVEAHVQEIHLVCVQQRGLPLLQRPLLMVFVI